MAQLTEMTPVVAASQTAFRQHREGLNDLTVDSFMQLPYLFEGDDEAKQQLEHSILQLVQNDVECECLEQALQEVRPLLDSAASAHAAEQADGRTVLVLAYSNLPLAQCADWPDLGLFRRF